MGVELPKGVPEGLSIVARLPPPGTHVTPDSVLSGTAEISLSVSEIHFRRAFGTRIIPQVYPPLKWAGCYQRSLRDPGFVTERASEQLFLPPEISERADIGQGKVKAELVLVANRAQGKAPVFDAQAATIPVIGQLHR
jgi:hypothetical protein